MTLSHRFQRTRFSAFLFRSVVPGHSFAIHYASASCLRICVSWMSTLSIVLQFQKVPGVWCLMMTFCTMQSQFLRLIRMPNGPCPCLFYSYSFGIMSVHRMLKICQRCSKSLDLIHSFIVFCFSQCLLTESEVEDGKFDNNSNASVLLGKDVYQHNVNADLSLPLLTWFQAIQLDGFKTSLMGLPPTLTAFKFH